jgi:hypothetical protein
MNHFSHGSNALPSLRSQDKPQSPTAITTRVSIHVKFQGLLGRRSLVIVVTTSYSSWWSCGVLWTGEGSLGSLSDVIAKWTTCIAGMSLFKKIKQFHACHMLFIIAIIFPMSSLFVLWIILASHSLKVICWVMRLKLIVGGGIQTR